MTRSYTFIYSCVLQHPCPCRIECCFTYAASTDNAATRLWDHNAVHLLHRLPFTSAAHAHTRTLAVARGRRFPHLCWFAGPAAHGPYTCAYAGTANNDCEHGRRIAAHSVHGAAVFCHFAVHPFARGFHVLRTLVSRDTYLCRCGRPRRLPRPQLSSCRTAVMTAYHGSACPYFLPPSPPAPGHEDSVCAPLLQAPPWDDWSRHDCLSTTLCLYLSYADLSSVGS